MDKFLPIVYVRGYAGTQSEVEQTVDDPFYGFNLGSTHIRQDQNGGPDLYYFESPLLRLIAEHNYVEVFNGRVQEIKEGCDDALKTIWIHRYYDVTAKTFGSEDSVRLTVLRAAENLREFINTIRDQVVAWQKNKQVPQELPKVYLVAHSMGGLVCRSLLQKVYPEKKENPHEFVDKLFTYATPHGGIHFDFPGGGSIEKLRDILGINESDSFGARKMYEFLTPGAEPGARGPDDYDPTEMSSAVFNTRPSAEVNFFSPDRVFCLVGTNSKDYEALYGLSRTAVGPKSDGLVQIESASVRNSHRAYVHRSHSGRYGIVNSEEGYLNMERFLFGDIKARTVLCNLKLFGDSVAPLPDVRKDEKLTYFVETRIAVRGLPVSMHERSLEHSSAVSLNAEQYERQFKHDVSGQRPGLPLYTAFLIRERGRKKEGLRTLQYGMRLAIHLERFRDGWLVFTDHIERLPLWTDYLVVELRVSEESPEDYQIWAKWLSENPGSAHLGSGGFTKVDAFGFGDSEADFVIKLPEAALKLFGPEAAIRLETFFWNDWFQQPVS